MASRAALLQQVSALEGEVQSSTSLDTSEKQSIAGKFEGVKDEIRLAFENDTVFYRIVVIGLCVAMVSVVVAVTFLTFYGKTNYESLTAIGSAAVGALAGLLAPSPIQK